MFEPTNVSFATLTCDEAPDWRAAPPSLTTSFNETHLWRFGLSRSAEHGHALSTTLSAEERSRADRFKSVTARHRFIVGRATLREILSRYLQVRPAEITIAYGPHGKPTLAVHPSLQFNLSHSHDVALLAVRCGRPVGIDVERLDDSPDHVAIAAESFAVDEARSVATAAPADRTATFLRLWTRREAVLKALGVGLTGASQESVDAADAEVHTITPIANYVASIARL